MEKYFWTNKPHTPHEISKKIEKKFGFDKKNKGEVGSFAGVSVDDHGEDWKKQGKTARFAVRIHVVDSVADANSKLLFKSVGRDLDINQEMSQQLSQMLELNKE